ncbi:MAG: HEAT repeat domain-containing protein, partial [Phycisphaeraceae bacterium]|nr:HEAT repeat domain-containing protein [Phycisphaeraceae bacterium]
DPNLRMIAAQSLGQTKSAAATRHLATAVSDPNELVATVAIAALEEAQAKDQADVLIASLSDRRWRVRAAAAKVLGKLRLKQAAGPLKKLLKDPDPFVVKSALDALKQLDASPSASEVRQLAKRFPDLTGEAVQALLHKGGAESLEAIAEMFSAAPDDVKLLILDSAVGSNRRSAKDDDHWKPLLAAAFDSKSPKIRMAGVRVLATRSEKLTGSYMDRLLADADPSIRALAAAQVIRLAAYHWGIQGDRSDQGDQGLLGALGIEQLTSTKPPKPTLSESAGKVFSAFSKAITGQEAQDDTEAGRLKRGKAIYARYLKWHRQLKELAGPDRDVRFNIATYVSGDGREAMSLLSGVLDSKQPVAVNGLEQGAWLGLVLKRMPWPAGRDLLLRAASVPSRYPHLLAWSRHGSSEFQTLIREPRRMIAALADEEAGALQPIAEYLIESAPPTYRQSLGAELIRAEPGSARALGWVLKSSLASGTETDLLKKALHDSDPGVRFAAVQAAVRLVEDQERREALLVPLLQEKDLKVFSAAAAGILSPEVRRSSDVGDMGRYFIYGDTQLWMRNLHPEVSSASLVRPLEVIQRQPPWLSEISRRIRQIDVDGKSESKMALLSMVLAQYGDFSGMDRLLTLRKAETGRSIDQALAVALQLSRNKKYAGYLTDQIESATSEYQLRYLLKPLRGIHDDWARELRRQINAKMRQVND